MILFYRVFLKVNTTYEEQYDSASKNVVLGCITVTFNAALFTLCLMAKANNLTVYVPFTNLILS